MVPIYTDKNDLQYIFFQKHSINPFRCRLNHLSGIPYWSQIDTKLIMTNTYYGYKVFVSFKNWLWYFNVSEFLAYMYACAVCVPLVSMVIRRGHWIFWNFSYGWCACWEKILSPLQKQRVLLTMESTFQIPGSEVFEPPEMKQWWYSEPEKNGWIW